MTDELLQNAAETESLAESLEEIDDMSVGDRTVKARIVNITEFATEIKMSVELPDGERISERFDKPQPWSDRFEFVKIAQSYNYGPGEIAQLIGEQIKVRRYDGEWSIVTPGIDYKKYHLPMVAWAISLGYVLGVVALSIAGSHDAVDTVYILVVLAVCIVLTGIASYID